MMRKLKRFATSLLPVDETRGGECNRCGECCKLPYPCPFLRYDEDGLSSCAVYAFRPPSCRKYPRTRAENLTKHSCGYYFVSVEEIRASARAKRPQDATATT
jgi:Fe-S-cluster containining protein